MRSGTGVIEDLCSGQVTVQAIRAVRQAAVKVVRAGRFRCPCGSYCWSADDIDDLVGDFLVGPPGTHRLMKLAFASTGREHFQAGVETSLRRLLIDRIRDSEEGQLDHWSTCRLKRRADVALLKRWRWVLLEYRGEEIWAGNEDALDSAAAAFKVCPPPWRELSKRQGPITDGASLDGLCTAILRVAGRPLDHQVLRRVLARRLLHAPTSTTEMSLLDKADPGTVDGPVWLVANDIWAKLDDQARALLPDLTSSAREIEAGGGFMLKKSAIYERRRTLLATIRTALDDVDEPLLVVRALLQHHERWSQESWVARRTNDTGVVQA